MNLTGKVAIITGASKGIGLATAEALLAKGAVVAGWSRSAPANFQHENFHFVECDVQDEASVQQAFAATAQRLGNAVHVLVNNAGIGEFGPVDGFSSEAWRAMFATNVDGAFYCTKAVLPPMKKQREGHIINVASLAGTAGSANLAGYCATKFALRGFSDALFKEVRQDGVRVTCVMPGSVETSFGGTDPSGPPNPHKMQPEDIAAAIIHALEAPEATMISEIQMRPSMPK